MGRPKGGKNKTWTTEEKLRIVMRVLNGEASQTSIAKEENVSDGQISTWIKKYDEHGERGLDNKVKNPYASIVNKSNPTELEKLQYENFKLKMENELLKKGLDPERVMRIANKKNK